MFDFVDRTSSDVGDFRDVPRLISAVANLTSTDLNPSWLKAKGSSLWNQASKIT
jgi:hypothetical protein